MPLKTIFLSAGEPSGDQHVARLIQALSQRDRDLHFRGFGGPEMRAAGCRLDYELTQMAVMGIVEVIPKLRQFFAIADLASKAFVENRPDAVVLADFPGFNWHIAKRAKKHGIPVYYYLPPQLWAWGSWRIGKMRRHVDHVLSVLPFENQWYLDKGISSTFVGHPFFDAVSEKTLDTNLLRQLEQQIANGSQLIAVLPGSRWHEVQRNWPVMLPAIRELAKKHPQARFMVASYRDAQCLWCRSQMQPGDAQLPLDFFVGKTSEVIEAAHCAMMVSGSVSLELMARGTPAAVIYRVSKSLHFAGKALVRVPSMTLPNLIAGKPIFPELASSGQPEVATDFLIQEISRYLVDHEYYRATRDQLDELRIRYAQPGATSRAAGVICQQLGITQAPMPLEVPASQLIAA